MASNETYLTTEQVQTRLGEVSDVTIWRWMKDPRVNFPQPYRFSARRRLWALSEIEAWELARAVSAGTIVERLPQHFKTRAAA